MAFMDRRGNVNIWVVLIAVARLRHVNGTGFVSGLGDEVGSV